MRGSPDRLAQKGRWLRLLWMLVFGMPGPVEIAFEAYVRAWGEPDAATREKLVEACWAEDGRLVTLHQELRGRAALCEEMARVLDVPDPPRIRIVSKVQFGRTTFRVRAVVETSKGTGPETFDAGEIDEAGRIRTILTFAGPLDDARSG